LKTVSSPIKGAPIVSPNQNYFSKEYVDELQSFYQREREAYRTKIYNLEGELESTKVELTGRIEDLNRQVERSKYTQDYLEKVESQNKQYTESIREKE
jgi:vacuolar-type H+-ATPase subunit I/STV1